MITDDRALMREMARVVYYEHERGRSPDAAELLEEAQGRVATIRELMDSLGIEYDIDDVRRRAAMEFLQETGLTPAEASTHLRADEEPVVAPPPSVTSGPRSIAKPVSEAMEDVLVRLLSDFPYFCKMCLEIAYRPGLNPAAPDGGYGPFILAEGQMKVAAVMLDQYLNNEAVRIIILKSRQLGITTLLMAFWLWLALQVPGITIMIIIDKGDHLVEKRQTYLHWLEKIGELFPDLPNIKRRGNKVIELTSMARILFESAESPNPGTSEHIKVLHTSEKPKWPRGRDRQIDASVVPGLPEKPRTIYVDESTAEGVNGFYYRWQRCVEGKADVTPIFLPWYVSSEYSLEPPVSCYSDSGEFIYMNDDVEVSETDESGKIVLTEKEYAGLFELSDAQVYWRRNKIKNAFGGDRSLFDQEYPTTPAHAWQTVGGKFFTHEEITRCESAIELPLLVGNLVDGAGHDDPLRLLPYGEYVPTITPVPYGSLKIRQMPIPGAQYYIGGDVAEGRQAVNESGATDYDYTVFVVKDSEGRTVALFRDRIKPEEAALPLMLLGMLYNMALINCERNGPGQVVWSMFRQTGYYNIHYREGKGHILDRAWTITTASNRHPMLYALRASYREDPVRPGFKETVDEMNEIIIDKKGKVQARSGAHDDIFMAEAHAWSMIYAKKGVMLRPVEKIPEPVPENEFAATMKHNGVELW